MATVFLTPADLVPFADVDPDKAQAMIDDATALAKRVAPCITAPDFVYEDAVKAILRGAVLRWNEAGTGAVQTEVTGPFSQTVQFQARRGMFWPSEIEELQNLCKAATAAYAVDVVPTSTAMHADICSLNFGANYCSCGADLTLSFPLYEV